MTNTRHYTYRVIWSEEEREFVGLCAEFPGLSWLADTMEGALGGIARVWLVSSRACARPARRFPEPLSARRFSRKFQVRTTPERHRLLAMQAAEAGVSINRFVNDRLAR